MNLEQSSAGQIITFRPRRFIVPKVRLEKLHISFADKIAHWRRQNAVENDREPHNGAPCDPAVALSMDLLGTRCEAAGKVYFNPVTWHAYKRSGIRNLPDLEAWIDVKGRSKHWHQLIVQKDDDPSWAYVLVCGQDHPVYSIVGWLWGEEAMQERFWDEKVPGRPAYFAKGPLRDPAELLREVRRRQGRRTHEQ